MSIGQVLAGRGNKAAAVLMLLVGCWLAGGPARAQNGVLEAGPISGGNQDVPAGESESSQVGPGSSVDQPEVIKGPTGKQQETAGQRDEMSERVRLKKVMMVTIFLMVVFFLFVFLITMLRVSRFHKRRMGLGRRGQKTKYVDAWSQYRLKDEPQGQDDQEATD